jgi:hypothetical protein
MHQRQLQAKLLLKAEKQQSAKSKKVKIAFHVFFSSNRRKIKVIEVINCIILKLH